MRHVLIVIAAAVVAAAIGLGIYHLARYDAPDAGQAAAPATIGQAVHFTVLKEGGDAPDVFDRVNYRIKTADEFATLWGMLYGADAPKMPSVDFDEQDVIAVFDGTHSTGGFDVTVSAIADSDVRTVTVSHTAPGAGCTLEKKGASPYQLVAVPKSALTLKHEDASAVADCK